MRKNGSDVASVLGPEEYVHVSSLYIALPNGASEGFLVGHVDYATFLADSLSGLEILWRFGSSVPPIPVPAGMHTVYESDVPLVLPKYRVLVILNTSTAEAFYVVGTGSVSRA